MRLIIFDVDGTLLDSQRHILAAQARAFTVNGLPVPTREDSLSIVGLSLHEAFLVLAGPDGPIEQLAEDYKAAWFEMRTGPGFQEVLYPGARDLVADLAARSDVTLGIATGKSQRGVDRIIADQGWEGLFSTVQTSDAHPSKPHPSMLQAALAETGMAPEAAVMIGDTSFDMEMAVAAGVRPIGVTWGYHPRAALVDAADIADDFAGLRAILARDMVS